MTLRGSGTEFHDTTISVNGTDQKTFGQDTDSAYDVTATVDQAVSSTFNFDFNGNTLDGNNQILKFSPSVPFDVTQTFASFSVAYSSPENDFDGVVPSIDLELRIGESKVGGITDSGYAGNTNGGGFSGAVDEAGSASTVKIIANDTTETKIVNVSGFVDVNQSLDFDPPVDSVIKTE